MKRLIDSEINMLVDKVQDAVAYTDGALWRERAKKAILTFLADRDSATSSDIRYYYNVLDSISKR